MNNTIVLNCCSFMPTIQFDKWSFWVFHPARLCGMKNIHAIHTNSKWSVAWTCSWYSFKNNVHMSKVRNVWVTSCWVYFGSEEPTSKFSAHTADLLILFQSCLFPCFAESCYPFCDIYKQQCCSSFVLQFPPNLQFEAMKLSDEFLKLHWVMLVMR